MVTLRVGRGYTYGSVAVTFSELFMVELMDRYYRYVYFKAG